MSKLFEIFYILNATDNDCKEAMLTDIRDYEDAVILCCSVYNHIDYIVTRNIKDYEKSKVQAILPDQLLKMALHRTMHKHIISAVINR